MYVAEFEQVLNCPTKFMPPIGPLMSVSYRKPNIPHIYIHICIYKYACVCMFTLALILNTCK